jgi:hypothetical protein
MISSFVAVALLAIAVDARPQAAAAPALPATGENGKMGGIFGMGDISFKDVLFGTPSAKSGGTGISFANLAFAEG